MPAPFADLRYTRARARRRPWAGKRIAFASLALFLLAALGYGGYRGVLYVQHRAGRHETAASHSLNQTQLSQLQQLPPSISDKSLIRDNLAAAQASPSPVPVGAILKVPYTVQAPFGNWKFHQESCEEAALLMYHDFIDGDQRANIPPAEADKDLRALKAWQVQNWGSEVDLSLDRTGQLAQAYYNYHYQVIQVSPDTIKQAISDGHLVVVPVMTHALQNPHYGPMTVYHEVVVKGYTNAGVVTNDAGVQEGKDWFYSWSVLMGAIDAQTPKMHQGRVGLILTR